jgi:hypothetical protein
MSGSGSSFSVATTIFVSLAICAVISYGVFYYFKQRLSVIEQSQMEQARVMQSFIARSIMQQQAQQHHQQQQQHQPQQCQEQEQQPQQPQQQWHKEITVTESGLIEVSSDSESESDSDDESQSSDQSSQSSDQSSKSDKWSIGDEIHQPDSLHESFIRESQKKHIHIDNAAINLDAVEEVACDENDTKKIISLNKTALGGEEADESDSDSESESESEEIEELEPFELKIGYKDKDGKDKGASNAKKANQSIQLNYSNMSVPALRQVAKERGLGGEDADLNKLKKKDLVQLLQ